MTTVKILSISCFLIFIKGFKIIPPENKDAEVVYVQKMCLINLSYVLCNWKVLKVVNLTLSFSRKYRCPEHYFSVWCLWISQKLQTAKQFLVSAIFFTIMNISFFNLCFYLFSIIAKVVNQIRNNVVCVVARLVFVFCCALTTGLCNAFQHIFVNWKKSDFYSPYFQTVISCDYELIN